MTQVKSTEKVVQEIRRKPRRRFSGEKKVRTKRCRARGNASPTTS